VHLHIWTIANTWLFCYFWFLNLDLELRTKSCVLHWILASDVTEFEHPLCHSLAMEPWTGWHRLSICALFLPRENKWDESERDRGVNALWDLAKFGISEEKIWWIRQSHTHNAGLERLLHVETREVRMILRFMQQILTECPPCSATGDLVIKKTECCSHRDDILFGRRWTKITV